MGTLLKGTKNVQTVLIFTGILYLLSIGLSLAIGLTGGSSSPLIGLAIASMLLPAAAVLFVRWFLHEELQIPWNSFPWIYLPFALFFIPVVMHTGMLSMTYWLEGGIHWQDWLQVNPDGLYRSPAWGVLTRQGLIARIVMNALVGILVVSFFSFFEEIGWRAWLLPRLERIAGTRKAIVIASIAWAVWHVPFALSGLQHINGMSTWEVAVVWPFGVAGTGLIIGWLWIRTQSIWLISIAHGALNNWGQLAFKYLDDFKVANPGYVLGAGCISLVTAGVILLLWALPVRFQPEDRKIGFDLGFK